MIGDKNRPCEHEPAPVRISGPCCMTHYETPGNCSKATISFSHDRDRDRLDLEQRGSILCSLGTVARLRPMLFGLVRDVDEIQRGLGVDKAPIRLPLEHLGPGFACSRRELLQQILLFLITQQSSLWVPDLQAVSVDYVMVWTQGFGGFDRRFEGLKRSHGMAAVSRDRKGPCTL
jgi:hypothetical protein